MAWTQEDRKLGGIRGLQTLREQKRAVTANKFDFPIESRELAEFTGILLGDGGIFLHKYMVNG